MTDTVFIETNELVGDNEEKQSYEMPFADVVKMWETRDNELDTLDEFPIVINGSPEEQAKWLNQLTLTGGVSDTEELLCWAVANTKEDAQRLLQAEIEKFA